MFYEIKTHCVSNTWKMPGQIGYFFTCRNLGMEKSLYLRTLFAYVKSNFFLEVEIEIYTPDKNGSQKLFAAEIT